jgi:pimeloyl-ACP methyl ester carboxylesterase
MRKGPVESEEPLVLLPGMNCSAALWSRLDLRDWPSLIAAELTEPTLAGQVARLVDELPPRFALAGLSLGGIVAMALLRTTAERVSSLILLSTNPHPPTDQQREGWRAARDDLRSGRSGRELQADWLPQLLSEPAQGQPDLVELTLAIADSVGEEHLDAQLALQATRIDERPMLRNISCPTRIIAARQDALCSVSKHTEMNELIPGSILTIIENCGHLSPLEQPDALRNLCVPARGQD